MLFGIFEGDKLSRGKSHPRAGRGHRYRLRHAPGCTWPGFGCRSPRCGEASDPHARRGSVPRHDASPAAMAIADKLGFAEYGRNVAVYLNDSLIRWPIDDTSRRPGSANEPYAYPLADRRRASHRAPRAGRRWRSCRAVARHRWRWYARRDVEDDGVEHLAHPVVEQHRLGEFDRTPFGGEARRPASPSPRAAAVAPPYPVRNLTALDKAQTHLGRVTVGQPPQRRGHVRVRRADPAVDDCAGATPSRLYIPRRAGVLRPGQRARRRAALPGQSR